MALERMNDRPQSCHPDLERSSENVGGSRSEGGPADSQSISLALCPTRWSQTPAEGRGRKDPSPNVVHRCVGVSHLPPMSASSIMLSLGH